MNLSGLEKKIIDISYKKGLSHINSCLTAVALIDSVYEVKKPEDIFILSNGHSGFALYVVLEKYLGKNAEELYDKHGVHPNRDIGDGIYVSAGSLGSAITLAIGMAIVNRKREVYVLLSDGECVEGSVWEALRIAGELRLENLKVMVNANGTGAYGKIDTDLLDQRINMFYPTLVVRTKMFKFPDYLQGVHGHYKILNEKEYKEIIN